MKKFLPTLYFRARLRYNIGMKQVVFNTFFPKNALKTYHKHNDTVCYYILCLKRCQPLLNAVVKKI